MRSALDEVLRVHACQYPLMEPADAVKLIYQHVMGGGHMVRDEAESLRRLQAELKETGRRDIALAEPLGNGMARMQLGALEKAGLSIWTANRLFVLSAQQVQGNRAKLEAALATLRAACRQGLFGFDLTQLDAYLADYIRSGCPAPGHSDTYRRAYRPAYRVVRACYLQAVPLLAAVDRCQQRQGHTRIAIDGRCASGKSTLGSLIAQIYGGNLFHMDDYFLRPEQRTRQRYDQPGGNVDRERFAEEVLAGLDSKGAFAYRPFDCATGQLSPPVTVEPKPVTVVEGSYSLHPELRAGYDVKIFLDIDPQTQSRRILARNGAAMHRRFMEQWIPLEERYFTALEIPKACDLIFTADDQGWHLA